MGFNKFDPHAPETPPERNPVAERRAALLKYGRWITLLYTLMGFGLIAYWLFD